MNNVMLDLETLGTRPGCVVLSIGAVAFDAVGLGREFYITLNIPDSKSLGLHEDQDTLAWWNKQGAEARAVLAAAAEPTAPKVGEALEEFTAYLKLFGVGSVKLWGNGANFDNPIIQEVYRAAGLKAPWRFYNDRCYRTLKNLHKSVPMPERVGTYHNALDDAKTQAIHASQIFHAAGFV